jgi:ribulose-5-phosphate 4-epimerase/fuculose-1-phosphate aldolase
MQRGDGMTAPELGTIGEEELRLRRELADFYHLVDFLGWGELIFNHISVRLPGDRDTYLVNPFGLHYSEITPENLVVVNIDGEMARPSEHAANPAGFALHGAIHSARHDVGCVAHTHTIPISAMAMKAEGMSHDTFYGAQLWGRIAYHDFEGITLYAEERSRMLASLEERSVLILRNHGVAVCERDVVRTFVLLWIVQRAAEVQCQAGMIPGLNIQLTPAVRERCVKSSERILESHDASRMLFDSQVRLMRRERPVAWHV